MDKGVLEISQEVYLGCAPLVGIELTPTDEKKKKKFLGLDLVIVAQTLEGTNNNYQKLDDFSFFFFLSQNDSD